MIQGVAPLYGGGFTPGGGSPEGVFAVEEMLFDSDIAGNVDYTTADLAGKTPKAALLLSGNHRAQFATWTTGMRIAFGAVDDAGHQVSIATRSENGSSSTDTSRRAYTDRAYTRISTLTGSVSNFAIASCITEGVRLDWDASSGLNDYEAMFMGFAGGGVSAHVGTIDLGTGTSAIDVTGVGFEADLVLFYSAHDAMDGASTDFMGFGFGAALPDGTERCVAWIEGDAAAAGNPLQTLFTDCAMAQINSGSGLAYKVTTSAFDADGFSVTPTASASGDVIGYLALKFTDESVAILDGDTPTATGLSSLAGAGFTPKAGISVATFLEAVDDLAVATSVQQSGLGIGCFTVSSESALGWFIESGADPADTGSGREPNALMSGGNNEPIAIRAVLDSMDSDGVTFDFTAVAAAAKKYFVILIGE